MNPRPPFPPQTILVPTDLGHQNQLFNTLAFSMNDLAQLFLFFMQSISSFLPIFRAPNWET